MPANFRKLGVSFQYPENWTLDEEDAVVGRKSVTVYSPGGGFWSLAVHPGATDPHRLAEAALKAMQQEYQEVETAPAEEFVAGHELTGFDLNFFYLDLTNTAVIRSLRFGKTAYTIFYQAEDHEFDQIQRVFEAMTTSFLKELKSSA